MAFFSSFYQDLYSIVLLFSPEVILAFNDYFFQLTNYNVNTGTASAYFDSYVSNMNYNFGDGILFFLCFLYLFGLLLTFFITSFFLK